MIAKQEVWKYSATTNVWIGKYINSRNLPHWHMDCELISVEKGQLEVVCENKTYVLDVNDAFFIDSEQVHYMQAKRPDTILRVIIFNYDVVKKLFADSVLICPKLEKTLNANRLYDELKHELMRKQPYYDTVSQVLITRCFVEVLRNNKTEQKKVKTTTGQLKALIDKIESEFESITFEQAYKFMAMDEAYFCRYFKKATGMTFSQYLNHRKIDNAIKLIKQDPEQPVTSVAYACGFGSIRHFNKTFKELTGYTPKTLPNNFVLTEFKAHTSNEFNPTLQDCLLIEEYS
ncbi:MAG: AraC family transcriptional regulator [Clostridia bacterium]|nr:AraC family transcriptional regulator [Clostridia bacterium]